MSSARRERRTCRLLGAAVAAACALATPASASAAPVLVLPSGLTEATGLAQTSNGSLWASDAAHGVCRIRLDTGALVQDGTWCGDPALHGGPAAPTQMAFDPATSNFYVGDSSSALGAVWRLHWNAGTDAIDSGVRIANFADDRVLGVALAPDGSVTFSTKRNGTISRIDAPATAPATVSIGSAQAKAAGSLADAGTDVYIAESTGVTLLADGTSFANPVPGLPGGVPSAVAADGAGHVYAGTTNANGRDQVDVLTTADGAVRTLATGFSGVGAILPAADGSVYVADDPSGASSAVGVVGQGRLWRIPPPVAGRPDLALVTGPPSFTNAATLHMSFHSAAGATFSCQVDDAPPAPCGTGPDGAFDTAPAEGVRTLTVTATDPPSGATSEPLRRTVVVDRTAPVVTMDSPAAGARVPAGAVPVRFSADDATTAFTCSVDGGPSAPCDPPLVLSSPAPGLHTVRVGGVDAAGNVATTVASSFDVAPAPPPPPPPAPGLLVPTGIVAAVGPVPVVTATPPAPPSACARPGRPRVSGVRWSGRRRSLVLRLAATDSRYVQVSIRSDRSALPQRLGRPLQAILLPGRATQVTWRLAHEQLPPRRRAGFTVAVSLARCRTAFGARAMASLPPR